MAFPNTKAGLKAWKEAQKKIDPKRAYKASVRINKYLKAKGWK